MLNFEFYNPTRIIFGRDALHRLPNLLQDFGAKKVLLAYGGGSCKRSGLLKRITDHLSGFEFIEFEGIEPNPEYDTLMKAVEIVRNENIDFILAIGGGSVIDGVKFISGAAKYSGDPWVVLERREGAMFTDAIPFGTILTLPATGSEANSGAVISRSDLKAKRTMGGTLFFPVFSFCDPSVVATLSQRQIANGIVDAYMHTMEQYLTYPSGNLLQEREAESILSTLIEIGEKLIGNPDDYNLAANLMICATHALNGNLKCGVPTDWTTHMIGHELTAHFGIDHARSLAIIAPRLYENQFENKSDKLAQYGYRVLGLSGDNREVAQKAIYETEEFFHRLGVKTRISEYTKNFQGVEMEIRATFEARNWNEMGERGKISPGDIEAIVKAAI